MNILLVTLEYLPPLTSGNGVYANAVASALKKLHKVKVVTAANVGVPSTPEVHPIPVTSRRALEDAGNVEFVLKGLKEVEALPVFNPSLVLGIDWHSTPICIALARTCGCKFIFMPFRIFSYFCESIFIRKLEELGANYADAIIALSEVDARLIKEFFGCAATIVNPPVSVRVLNKKKRDIILTISRVSREKGIEKLIRALPKVNSSLSLVIAGHIYSEQYLKELKELSRGLGVEARVTFTGTLPQPQLWKLYSEAKIYVSPSKYEPFGLSIAEAAALGLPVVMDSSGMVGAGELFEDKKSCLKVDVSNEEELAGAINLLACDLELSKRIGRNARKAALRLSKSSFSAEINKFIWGVVNS